MLLVRRLFLLLFILPTPLLAQTTLAPQTDIQRQTLTDNQPTSEPPLDLKAAVQKAIDNNHAIQVARHKIEQNKYDTSTTKSLLYPNVNFQGKAGSYTAPSNNPYALFGGDPYNQYNANLNLVQPLFAFGSLAAIRVKDYDTKMSELDLEIAIRSLTVQVIEAFYQVLLNQRLVDIRDHMLKAFNESLATAQHRVHTGRGQLLDVLSVKTQIALLKPQIEDAHNQLESAGAQLATYLAEQGKYELQLKGTLKGLRMKDVMKRLDFKDARLPELERVHLQSMQVDEQKDVTEGQHLPNLTLNGDYGQTSFTKGGLGSDYGRSWDIYLQLNIPIFSGLESVWQRKSLVEQASQIEQQGHDLENTLALNQVQSLKTLQSKGASLESAEDAANLADQSMGEARRNYRLATIDFLQFLQIEQQALQADSQLDQIKYDNIDAFAKYFVATGQPLPVLIDILQEKRK